MVSLPTVRRTTAASLMNTTGTGLRNSCCCIHKHFFRTHNNPWGFAFWFRGHNTTRIPPNTTYTSPDVHVGLTMAEKGNMNVEHVDGVARLREEHEKVILFFWTSCRLAGNFRPSLANSGGVWPPHRSNNTPVCNHCTHLCVCLAGCEFVVLSIFQKLPTHTLTHPNHMFYFLLCRLEVFLVSFVCKSSSCHADYLPSILRISYHAK